MGRARIGEDIRTSQPSRVLVGKGYPLDLAVCLYILFLVITFFPAFANALAIIPVATVFPTFVSMPEINNTFSFV